MDDRLKKALEFSNHRYSFSLKQKNLKEKIEAKLTYGYNGGIFKINRDLLNFVDMLVKNNRTNGVVLLDINENPIIFDDLEKFKDEIFDRYFSSCLEYYDEFSRLKKSRSVESVLDV